MPNNKLVVLSGLSGSGKTTKALELCAQDESLHYIGYDILRVSTDNESPCHITTQLFAAVGMLLAQKKSVIVDAVNLHPHDKLRWEAVAWAYHASLEWLCMTTSHDVCIARDLLRAEPVGELAILGQLAMSLES